MASSSAPVHPARYLSVFLVLLIGVYLLVFLTGDKKATPKLGIDLQGGTRVTLTARTPDGTAPSRQALNQAQQIISARVNGLGVSGSEVVVDGDNLVITVPGNDGNEARNLGQTARLYIRPVLNSMPAQPAQEEPKPPAGTPPPSGAPAPPPSGAPAAPPSGAPAAPPSGAPAQPRPYPQEPPPSPAPAPSPAPSDSPAPPSAGVAPPADLPPGEQPAPPDPRKDLAERIAQEKKWRQSTSPYIQMVALQFEATRCDKEDILAGNDDPKLPLVTCSTDHKTAYLLEPSIISGDQIQDATFGMDQRGVGYVVDLQFKSGAADEWARYTAAHLGKQTAFTLDSQVVSAPQILEPIPGGRTQISGGDPPFTAATARQLANVLKYGSLPLSFESSEAQTVSATLGLTSLRAGLIAGGIGLALVLVYSLLYYRVLGLLTALSLVASGAMVFAILVLLGRYINYTLDLAGIAGLIIGIGTTADSFVVFFERIKDEIREGRSFRSAVPRGWARARKTIVSGNAVTFLAAAVLYFLAIGQVKGFAFTLGLTTILDLVVVFLVTWPLVYLASKSSTLAKPAYNGLGAVQQVARERRAQAGAAKTGRG
ncbi:protein translocase subunit SecD [Mycobacterium kansasii]|uniref:Protein translocase subunit SecD n=7 Tax=Mycobacterium kansasii TaxID=1768 RepID=A0A653EIU1_MYCKA|nr:protein translocase subunit SecD [Mycobacterium kansasii]AGZ53401.1 preprotein translocase subunit SecD [Mycobacterium kansasii ATCC 12478]EUA21428.1 protein-export membrane protein SecD [Mycobacterium kansasii 662]KEP42526.1 preprotein translocase subunit SecD [Mycobacterium kansasii]KZS74723.1 preprotein translocase subunit SecD [Mycobacterium kansasii]MXO39417.1 protein translocase subunit SecD [Mycobacterium kansasii]